MHRGHLYAWLPIISYPSRLVQALILARDLGAEDLVSKILDKIQGDPVYMPNGIVLSVRESAERCADRYSAALGLEVDL